MSQPASDAPGTSDQRSVEASMAAKNSIANCCFCPPGDQPKRANGQLAVAGPAIAATLRLSTSTVRGALALSGATLAATFAYHKTHLVSGHLNVAGPRIVSVANVADAPTHLVTGGASVAGPRIASTIVPRGTTRDVCEADDSFSTINTGKWDFPDGPTWVEGTLPQTMQPDWTSTRQRARRSVSVNEFGNELRVTDFTAQVAPGIGDFDFELEDVFMGIELLGPATGPPPYARAVLYRENGFNKIDFKINDGINPPQNRTITQLVTGSSLNTVYDPRKRLRISWQETFNNWPDASSGLISVWYEVGTTFYKLSSSEWPFNLKWPGVIDTWLVAERTSSAPNDDNVAFFSFRHEVLPCLGGVGCGSCSDDTPADIDFVVNFFEADTSAGCADCENWDDAPIPLTRSEGPSCPDTWVGRKENVCNSVYDPIIEAFVRIEPGGLARWVVRIFAGIFADPQYAADEVLLAQNIADAQPQFDFECCTGDFVHLEYLSHTGSGFGCDWTITPENHGIWVNCPPATPTGSSLSVAGQRISAMIHSTGPASQDHAVSVGLTAAGAALAASVIRRPDDIFTLASLSAAGPAIAATLTTDATPPITPQVGAALSTAGPTLSAVLDHRPKTETTGQLSAAGPALAAAMQVSRSTAGQLAAAGPAIAAAIVRRQFGETVGRLGVAGPAIAATAVRIAPQQVTAGLSASGPAIASTLARRITGRAVGTPRAAAPQINAGLSIRRFTSAQLNVAGPSLQAGIHHIPIESECINCQGADGFTNGIDPRFSFPEGLLWTTNPPAHLFAPLTRPQGEPVRAVTCVGPRAALIPGNPYPLETMTLTASIALDQGHVNGDYLTDVERATLRFLSGGGAVNQISFGTDGPGTGAQWWQVTTNYDQGVGTTTPKIPAPNTLVHGTTLQINLELTDDTANPALYRIQFVATGSQPGVIFEANDVAFTFNEKITIELEWVDHANAIGTLNSGFSGYSSSLHPCL